MLKIFFLFLPMVFFLAVLPAGSLKGEESNQYLGDQLETVDRMEGEASADAADAGEDPFLPGEGNDQGIFQKDNLQGQPLGEKEIPEMDSQETPRDKVITQDGHIMGKYEENQEYLIPRIEEDFEKVRKSGRNNFSLIFSKDTYEYKNNSNSFDKIFRKSSKAEFPGILRVSGQKFLPDTLLGRLGAGLNLGVGYNGGKGVFLDGQHSESTMTLWSFPLDLALVYELSLFYSWIKVGAEAGPSVIGLLQNRSDLEDGDKRKSYRQVSWGYFGSAFARINFNKIFTGDSKTLFNHYGVTHYYLTLSFRTQEYSHFKSKDIAVTGTAWGLGLTYETF